MNLDFNLSYTEIQGFVFPYLYSRAGSIASDSSSFTKGSRSISSVAILKIIKCFCES